MLAITSCYKMASTNCLTAVAGVLPLDLEVRRVALKCRLRKGVVSNQEYEDRVRDLIAEWQIRYDETDKCEWTKIMIPDLARRCIFPLVLDHYTVQILMRHGDFKGKLHQFMLVQSPNCECGNGSETVRHVLLSCRRNTEQRRKLRETLLEDGEEWLPRNGAFLHSKKTYEALRTFSQESLKNKTDR